jgi:hypothetical protein
MVEPASSTDFALKKPLSVPERKTSVRKSFLELGKIVQVDEREWSRTVVFRHGGGRFVLYKISNIYEFFASTHCLQPSTRWMASVEPERTRFILPSCPGQKLDLAQSLRQNRLNKGHSHTTQRPLVSAPLNAVHEVY